MVVCFGIHLFVCFMFFVSFVVWLPLAACMPVCVNFVFFVCLYVCGCFVCVMFLFVVCLFVCMYVCLSVCC